MEKLGKMTQAGKKVLPDMSEKGFNIDIDILEALKKDEIVRANFHKFPSLYQRVRINYSNKKEKSSIISKKIRKIN